ncbi:hypothetical protein BH11PSE2_BH11PSE2_19660 [soil metagenome]
MSQDHTYRLSALSGDTTCRISPERIDLFTPRGRHRDGAAFADITRAGWVETAPVNFPMRRVLILDRKGRGALNIDQIGGGFDQAVELAAFYRSMAAVVRAMGQARPDLKVTLGPLSSTLQVLSAFWLIPGALGLWVLSAAFWSPETLAGRLGLAAFGLLLIISSATAIVSSRPSESPTHWTCPDLADEMERWARERG